MPPYDLYAASLREMIAIICTLLKAQLSNKVLDLLDPEPVNQICHAEEVDHK